MIAPLEWRAPSLLSGDPGGRGEQALHLAAELHGGQALVHRHVGIGQRLAGLDRLQELDVMGEAERQVLNLGYWRLGTEWSRLILRSKFPYRRTSQLIR